MTLLLRLLMPFAIGVLLAQAGCSPSAAGGDIAALIAPPSVSVVSAGAGAGATSVRQLAPTSFPADADYFTDPLHEYAFDRATNELDVVNDLLCLLAQARYGELVNQGLYVAQIDTQRCDPAQGAAPQSVGSVAYEDWIVRSRRRAFDEPQQVDLWVPTMVDRATGNVHTLFSTLDVFSPASPENPYGIFDLDFAGTVPFGDPHAAFYCGRLATKPAVGGRIGFTFFKLRGDLATLPSIGDKHHLIQVDVDLAVDQSSGLALVSRLERRNDPQLGDSGVVAKSFRLAFDATTLVRQEDAGPVVALARDSFLRNTRRYNLYVDDVRSNALGQRVELRTGMTIVLADGSNAWLSPFGIQLTTDVQVQDGDTVFEAGPNGATGPPLTLRLAPGKLIQCTRESAPLSALSGEVFEWTEPFVPAAPPPQRYHLSWNGTDFDAYEQFDAATGQWLPIAPFTVSPTTFGTLRMASKRYGRNCILRAGANGLAYYTERIASGDDALFGSPPQPLPLFGLLECLRPQLTGAEVDAGDIHFPPAPDVTQPWVYSFDPADRVLYFDDPQLGLQATTLAPLEYVSGGPFVDGMRSGPLVADTTGLSNVDDVWDLPVYFVWETGSNEWNRWNGVSDANGATVPFDAPVQFGYVHLQANDANNDPTFDGQQFLLEYRGAGQLLGIPFQPVDTDQDGQSDHDVPLFSIADGVAVGPGGLGYVVRAVERELVLQPAGGGPPPGLDPALADQLLLPDGRFYRTPAIGPVPQPSGSPAVVGGEIQSLQKR